MKNSVGPAGGEGSAIGDGPIAVSVGFFDDVGKPVAEKTLDMAVGVEFPNNAMPDVFVPYGPIDLGGTR
jgi:hypothetical protein